MSFSNMNLTQTAFQEDGRRILPRRTARSTAIETLHKLSTPKRERKKPTEDDKHRILPDKVMI